MLMQAMMQVMMWVIPSFYVYVFICYQNNFLFQLFFSFILRVLIFGCRVFWLNLD
jgi:hypothetical protein